MSQIWYIKGYKRARFHDAALEALREFPDEARKRLGRAIDELQKGRKLSMPLSRPMPSVAAGVEELRVRDENGAFRVFCYTRLANSVLVFHAFQKKTEKTPRREIDIARKRLKELLNEED